MTLPGNVIMMRRHNSTPHDVGNGVATPYYVAASLHQVNRIAPIDNAKPKKSWGERLKLGVTKADKQTREDERRQQQHLQQLQQQQEAAHNNYLVQEYHNKYGTLSDGSALSKSMKYAETWLYGSVRQPSSSHPLLYQQPPSMSVLPAELSRNTFTPSHIPHMTMCSCPEFIGGTMRSKKNTSSSGVCKKCGGSRLPWRGGGTLRAGTVRMTADAARIGGTVRVTSNRVRPSLMNVAPNMSSFVPDPYDLMRRNRLATPSFDDDDAKRGRRAKSTSPGRHNIRRSPSPPASRVKERRARRDMAWESDDLVAESPDNKRKSILECDVNPYRLISKTKGDEVEAPHADTDDELSDDMSDNALEDVDAETPAVSERKTKASEVEKSTPKGVTIGGQRIKVFAGSPSVGVDAEYVADEPEERRPASLIPRFQSPKRPQRRVKSLDGLAVKSTLSTAQPVETESGRAAAEPPPSSSNSQIERRSNLISSNIKSILKKPSSSTSTTTTTTTEAAGGDGEPSSAATASSQVPLPPSMTFSDTIREPDRVESQLDAERPATTTADQRTSVASSIPKSSHEKRESRKKKKQVQFDDSVTSNVSAESAVLSDVNECDVRDDKVIEVRFQVSEPAPLTTTTTTLKRGFGERKEDEDTLNGEHTDIGERGMAPTVGRVWPNQLLTPDALEMSSRDPHAVVTLRRSLSDRQMATGDDANGLSKQEQAAAMFHDTMRLRIMSGRRTDSRQAFSHPGSTLDLTGKTRRVLSPNRPKEPPPPPPLPPPAVKEVRSEAKGSNLRENEKETPKLKLVIAPHVATQKQDVNERESARNQSEIRFVNSEVASPPQLPPRHIFPFTKKQIQNINNQKRHNSMQTSPSSTLVRGNGRSKTSRPNSCIPQLQGAEADAGLVHVASRIRHRNSDPGPAMGDVTLRVADAGVRTVVSVCPDSPDIHRLQIKTDSPPSKRTSIRINGDDHATTTSVTVDEPDRNVNKVTISVGGVDSTTSWNTFIDTTQRASAATRYNHTSQTNQTVNQITIPVSPEPVYHQRSNVQVDDRSVVIVDRTTGKSLGTQHEYEVLEMLMDPVEAVRHHLVPHVCGRPNPDGGANLASASAMARLNSLLVEQKSCSESDASVVEVSSPESSLSEGKYSTERSSDNGDQDYNGISVHYFSAPRFVLGGDPGDDDKSDDPLANKDIYDDAENIYESIKDPIYEEIGLPDTPPPLPLSPPPSLDDLDDKRTSRSIFEGASKYDILNYLVDAKERGYVESDYSGSNGEEVLDVLNDKSVELSLGKLSSRISNLSNVSDSSEDNMAVITAITKDEVVRKSSADIERNDSGVGSETSKSSRSRWQTLPAGAIREDQTHLCEDCDLLVDTQVTDSGVMFAPLVCRKCSKKRAERKDTITEIVETEEKYGGDLRIILEEFYRPMLVAGLLTSEQLSAIFLNVEELLENNSVLAEKLRDAHDIAIEQGDEDLLTVNVGSLFLEAAPMLHAFESYCTRQGGASLLLANLEKEKELLRIFLRVSQMENAVLRRMNLNSFLMVPVQRVTKYPLLLARLHKVTPAHHAAQRELLKQAQHKIELHLEHMNSVAKDFSSTKLWRRISIVNGRRSSSEVDMINIKLRKMAVDVLEWNHDEVKFAMEGRMLYTNPTDNNWRKGRTIKLNPINALLVTNGKATEDYRPDDELLLFPRKSGVKEATLLLVKEKCGRYSLLREPLYLDKCIVCCETEWEDYIEVQELASKDTFIFKAEDSERTKLWYRQLQYHSQGLGAWRRRRNALANIMINGMMTRS